MNSKTVQPKSKAKPTDSADIIKYVLAIALAVGGLVAFYWFEGQWSAILRGALVVLGLVAGAAVFFSSSKGRQTLEFLGEARFELRKVVWPTRQEAMRTTWVVIAAVILIALMLAGFDVVIQWLVKWFLGR